MDGATQSSQRWSWLAGLALVLSLAVGVHWPALDNGYTYDDTPIARATYGDGRINPNIHELQSPLEYWRRHYWHGNEDRGSLYRPLTVWSYALVQHMGAVDVPSAARRQHAVNLLLHGLATLLVALLMRSAGMPVVASLLAAMVFAVHSVHSEVVATIHGRAELFGFVFGAAGTLLMASARRPWLTRGMAAVALFLAFCSKESALGWLLFAPLYAQVIGRRPGWAVLSATLLLPALAYLVPRQLVLGALPGAEPVSYFINPLRDLGWFERMPMAISLLGYGLWKLIWPFHCLCDYGSHVLPQLRSWFEPRVIASLVALVALVLASVWAWRRGQRTPALMTAAYLLFVLPTANLLFPAGILFSERALYAPSLSLSLALGLCIPWLRGWLRWAGLAVLMAWCAFAAVVDVQRCHAWHDDDTLFATDVAREPRSVALQIQAANARMRQGDAQGQIQHLEQAVAIEPRNAKAWQMLALSQVNRTDWAGARYSLEQGFRFVEFDYNKEVPGLLHVRGLLGIYTGKPAEAQADLRRALVLEPRFKLARADLGWLLWREGQIDLLQQELKEAQMFFANDIYFVTLQGLVDHRAGKWQQAVAQFEAAVGMLEWNPLRIEAMLAWADGLGRLGRADLAGQVLEPFSRIRNLDEASRERALRLRHQLGLK